MILNIFLLVTALGLDTFAASAAYGMNGISLSAKQVAAINAICSVCLGMALLLGRLLDSWIPERFTREICFFSLLILGCLKLMDSSIRRYLRRHKEVHRDIRFAVSQLHFIISIYGNPMEADANQKQHLSWKEVLFFSLAMSIDGMISGTMAAFLKVPFFLTMAAAFVMGEIFVCFGLWLGRKISSRCPWDVSWVGGVLLIILAVTKR